MSSDVRSQWLPELACDCQPSAGHPDTYSVAVIMCMSPVPEASIAVSEILGADMSHVLELKTVEVWK